MEGLHCLRIVPRSAGVTALDIAVVPLAAFIARYNDKQTAVSASYAGYISSYGGRAENYRICSPTTKRGGG